jgi:tetratricopeptide (TPR) repeat protein
MTEEVIGQLAQVRNLKVISRTSTEALKGTRLTLRQIADTLGVRHILEGSVAHEGDRIRVAVKLIDANTDTHVWTSRYDRDLKSMFAVQEEIARNVADTLGTMIGVRSTIGQVVRTEHPGAYQAYLAGRYLMYRRTREGLRGALERFQHSIVQDSSYAPAYAGMASVYSLWGLLSYSGIDLYEAYGHALAMADRTISLDPQAAEAYAARGLTLAASWAPAESVEADFRRALELRPNSADIHQFYALFLAREGRNTEGLSEAERAVALDPLAPGVRLGVALHGLAARRYDVTAQEAARASALEPSLMRGHKIQALGELLSGHPERCSTLSLGPYLGVRAMCLAAEGRLREAGQLVDSLRAVAAAGTAGDSIYSSVLAAQGLAGYYAWTGSPVESLEWLERAFTISPLGEEYWTISSGIYDKVRDDLRFKGGFKRIQLQVHDRVQRARLQASRR